MLNSVTGSVSGDDLGIVAIHEHLFLGLPGWDLDPTVAWDRPSAFDAIVADLRAFKALGGGAVVDAGGTFSGRNPDTLEKISRSSGVTIIATTGLGRADALPPHFSGDDAALDASALEALMADELAKGLVTAGMQRSPVRAGFVVAAVGNDEGLADGESVLHAAANAARGADVPLFVYGAGQAERAVEHLDAAGHATERLIVGHCDDSRVADTGRDVKFAGKGAYVSYDHIGWEDEAAAHGMSDENRVKAIQAVIDAGFVENILLSCSAIGCGLGMDRSGHTVSHLLESFVPRLNEAGIGDSAVHTMLVENPKRLLAGV